MLNEVREYNLYLSQDRKCIPLRNETTKKNLTGIRRPLQVLARGFLELCKNNDVSPTQTIAGCKVFLYGWICGEAHKDLATLKLPKSVLDECERARENSFLRYAQKGQDADAAQALADAYTKKARSWYQSPYTPKNISRENTFNQCYFSYIIADAICLGDLREQCLVLNRSGDQFYGLSGTDADRKIALAIVAQYLQLQQVIGNVPNREFLPIVQGEIGNWVNVRSKKSGSNNSVAKSISEVKLAGTDTLLMEKVLMNCSIKIRVSSTWLTNLDAKLIPEEDVTEDLEKSHFVISDTTLLVTTRGK
jgi:hypothetical protein